jgi:Domain of unknown function (DUF4149)
MNNTLRFLKVFALGTWVGSIIYFVVITQGIFDVLSRDQAGMVVGYALGRLHWMGIIAAVVFLAASLAMSSRGTDRDANGAPKALVRPAALGVILMLLLTLVSQRLVIPRIDVLRTQMGSVDATPPSNPAHAEFDRLHSVSVDLEVAVLLLGLVSLFLTAKEKHP